MTTRQELFIREFQRLHMQEKILTKERDDYKRQAARLSAWSTKLFNKLHAIECGECGKNMIACKCDD